MNTNFSTMPRIACTLIFAGIVLFAVGAVADDKEDSRFAYLELKTYEDARKKVLEGQTVLLYVGVPDPFAGGGSYVYHCHVPTEVMRKYFMPLIDGVWTCALNDKGKPMATLIEPKTKPTVKECK